MKKFQCQRCGCCCKITPELLECLSLPLVAVFAPIKNGSCRHLVKRNDGTYDCGIYEDRPYICRVDYMAKQAKKNLGLTLSEYYDLTHSACVALQKESGYENDS